MIALLYFACTLPEMIDPRETRYIKDGELLATIAIRMPDHLRYPRLAMVHCLPPGNLCREADSFAREHYYWLLSQRTTNQDWDYSIWIAETNAIRAYWQQAAWARSDYVYPLPRRAALQEIKKLLGPEWYNTPVPIAPLWRFRDEW